MKPGQPSCQNCLRRSRSVFSACNIAELDDVSVTKSCRVYKKGEPIFEEEDAPHGIFCIFSGMVKVTKLGASGKEHIVRIAGSGDVLGYRALLGNGRYKSSAVTIEESRVCLIPRETFFRLLKENIKFHDGIMKIVCAMMEQAETKSTEIAYKPVRSRIAEALIMLDRVFEERGAITLTREDLASFVGTVKETAIRVISDFKEEQLIEVDKRSIRVLNPDGLMRISNLYD